MRTTIVLFALGVWLLQREAELPPLEHAWALFALVPAFAFARARAPLVRYAARAAIAVCALGTGYMWAAGLAHLRLADALPEEWEARDIEVIGVVASLPQNAERSAR